MKSPVQCVRSIALLCTLFTACGGDENVAGPGIPPDLPRDEDGCDENHIGAVERRTRYEYQVAPAGKTCVPQEQVRRCSEQLAWSEWNGEYTAETCSLGTSSCEALPHGSVEVRERYEAASVPYGTTCKREFQTRGCSNGALGEWTGTFTHESCRVEGPRDCWGDPHGAVHTWRAWERAEVPFGEECKWEDRQRTCENGAWSEWSGSYESETCRVRDAASCGELPHGFRETRVRYREALVPEGGACEHEDQVRSCNDGKYADWSGTFTVESCEVIGQRPCHAIDEQGQPVTVKHGGREYRWRYAAPTATPNNCRAFWQMRLCADGQFQPWTTEYQYETCVEIPRDCGDLLHGETFERLWYARAYDTECVSATVVHTCNNGLVSPPLWTNPIGHVAPYCAAGAGEVAEDVGSERCTNGDAPICYEYRGLAKAEHERNYWCDWVDGEGCPTGGTYSARCVASDVSTYLYWPSTEDDGAWCTEKGGVWEVAGESQAPVSE